MADNVNITPGTGKAIAADEVSGAYYQRVKISYGPDGSATDVEAGAPFPVTDAAVLALLGTGITVNTHAVTQSGSWTVAISGTVAVTQSGTWDEVGINDSGNSITVDAPVGAPVFVQLSDGAAPITALPITDNGGTLSVDDGASSLTVDNTGTFAVQQVPGGSATATLTQVNSSASSQQLLASTAGRKGLFIQNTDANALCIKFGTTATTTGFTVRLVQYAFYEMPAPLYTGRIDGIWEADGSGAAVITELT